MRYRQFFSFTAKRNAAAEIDTKPRTSPSFFVKQAPKRKIPESRSGAMDDSSPIHFTRFSNAKATNKPVNKSEYGENVWKKRIGRLAKRKGMSEERKRSSVLRRRKRKKMPMKATRVKR